MDWTGLTVPQLERAWVFTLLLAFGIALVALGACTTGDVMSVKDETFFKRQVEQSH